MSIYYEQHAVLKNPAGISLRHVSTARRTRFADSRFRAVSVISCCRIRFVINFILSNRMASRALLRQYASGISKSSPGYFTLLIFLSKR